MIKSDGRHLAPAQLPASDDAPVPGDHPEVAVNQHRDVEPKGLDTAGNLSQLFGVVNPGITGIHSQIVDAPIDNPDMCAPPGRISIAVLWFTVYVHLSSMLLVKILTKHFAVKRRAAPPRRALLRIDGNASARRVLVKSN
jgi:hypothetical protein